MAAYRASHLPWVIRSHGQSLFEEVKFFGGRHIKDEMKKLNVSNICLLLLP